MQKLFKKEKGITLIALVVTIIVLLILASISINLLFGENGIITKARGASDAQVLAQIKEDIALKQAEKAIDGYLPGGGGTTPIGGNPELKTAQDFGGDIGGTGRLPTDDEKNTSGITTEPGKVNPVVEGVDPNLVEKINGTQTPEPPPTPNPSVGDEVTIGEKPFIVIDKNSDGDLTVIAKEPVPVDINTGSGDGTGTNPGGLTDAEIEDIAKKHDVELIKGVPGESWENWEIVLPSGNKKPVADLLPGDNKDVSNPEWELVEDNDDDGKVSLGDLVRPLKQEVASEEFFVIKVESDKVTLLAKWNLSNTANSNGYYMQLVNGRKDQTKVKFDEYEFGEGRLNDNNMCYWPWMPPEATFTPNLDLNVYTDDEIINTYSFTKENNVILKARDYANVIGGDKVKGRLLVYEETNELWTNGTNEIKNIIKGTYNEIDGRLLYWLGSTTEEVTPCVQTAIPECIYVDSNGVHYTYDAINGCPPNSGEFGVRPALEVPVSKMPSSGGSGSSGASGTGTGVTSSIKTPVWQDSYGATSNYKDTPTSTINWRLFYADSDYVYLISEDMLVENEGNIIIGGSYSDGLKVSDIGKSLNSEYSRYFTASNTSKNVQAVAWLTDTEYWKKYVPSAMQEAGVVAIGGPTIELFQASWNAARAQDTSRTQMSVTVNNKGYDKGGLGARGSIKVTYNDGLYRPSSPTETNATLREAYLIASPSSSHSDYVRHINCYDGYGYVNSGDVTLDRKVRPIVRVPASMVTREGTGIGATVKIQGMVEEVPVTGALGQPINTTNYGRQVANYNAQNLVWRLFFEDSNNIYLISETQDGDYPVKYLSLAMWDGNIGAYSPKNSKYVSGESISRQAKDLMPLLGGARSSGAGTVSIGTNSDSINLLTSSNKNLNILGTAYLCDTDLDGPWKDYKTGNAAWAMGGPTVELFTASYNATHTNHQISLDIQDYGYHDNTGYNWFSPEENGGIYDLKSAEDYWWLASPSNNSSSYVKYVLDGSRYTLGTFSHNGVTGTEVSARPVVCIQKSSGFECRFAD